MRSIQIKEFLIRLILIIILGVPSESMMTLNSDEEAKIGPHVDLFRLFAPGQPRLIGKAGGDSQALLSPELEAEWRGHTVKSETFFLHNLTKMSLITASGDALKFGRAMELNSFLLTTKGGISPSTCLHLSVEIEGPGQPGIWTRDNGDGTVEVAYRTPVPGKYKVNVTYQGNHIKGSPFNLTIR